MTLADFLTDADPLLGERVKVNGCLCSDGSRLWLAYRTEPAERLVVVDAPEVTVWFRTNLCPRLGGAVAYLVAVEVRGVVQSRNWEGLPVIGGEVSIAFGHGGRVVTLRGGTA